ncbi:MAG: hypothetical protein ACBR50_18950 [Microcoleus sp.]
MQSIIKYTKNASHQHCICKAGLDKLIHRLEFAIHPMTQILEKSSTRQKLNQLMGSGENIQFILRSGYLKSYPPSVSLRRPVDWFLRK